MFESAEIGNRIDKETYQKEEPRLRAALLEAQRRLADSKRSVIILVGGVEGAGKSETVNLLLEWLDGRGVEVHALGAPTDEERERPRYFRFWRMLPSFGRIGIFFGSWYTDPIVDRTYKRIDAVTLKNELHRITQFERMLNNEGVVLVKIWMHLSKAAQKKRLRQLDKNPATRWRITPLTWKYFKKYDQFRKVSEESLRYTSLGFAPWRVVEAVDDRFRNLTVATHVLQAIEGALRPAPKALPAAPAPPAMEFVLPKTGNLVNRLDLSRALAKKDYDKQLLKLEAELNALTRQMHHDGRSMILVFEGPDAAGKGGTIRRLVAPMDSRIYQFMSVAAPTDEERAHPYLWRFWRQLPRQGRVTIYDRSWYGRVLVERIEGFCTAEEWGRAYSEITQFEEQLTEFRTVVLKFWLAISSEEQLQRFKERQTTPYKQYKLTEEDWRNRAKWDAYENVASEMIERTSTRTSPWVLVEANDKFWARIKVMKTVRDALKNGSL